MWLRPTISIIRSELHSAGLPDFALYSSFGHSTVAVTLEIKALNSYPDSVFEDLFSVSISQPGTGAFDWTSRSRAKAVTRKLIRQASNKNYILFLDLTPATVMGGTVCHQEFLWHLHQRQCLYRLYDCPAK